MMHGMVFRELETFVSEKYGKPEWKKLLEKAGLADRVYLPVNEYPDGEILSLAKVASEMTKLDVGALLEAFGEFVVPSLLKLYGHLLKPEWKTLEVINHTENAVHAVVRMKNPGAKPPFLKTRREAESVVLIYHSPRKMCSFAIGIGRGLAKHFQEKISIRETECMHKGAQSCVIVFKRTT